MKGEEEEEVRTQDEVLILSTTKGEAQHLSSQGS
jgi:hypothetical protein